MADLKTPPDSTDAQAAPARGEVTEVTIEKVIFGGDGLARISQGFVVFVPFTAEGDR